MGSWREKVKLMSNGVEASCERKQQISFPSIIICSKNVTKLTFKISATFANTYRTNKQQKYEKHRLSFIFCTKIFSIFESNYCILLSKISILYF
jgi:hypothetical protein